jgi:hypothetical protein
MDRKKFIKLTSFGIVGFLSQSNITQRRIIIPKEFKELPSFEYSNVNHSKIYWENVSRGLDFARVEVYMKKKLVDIITTLKINPEYNKIKVFNNYKSLGHSEAFNIEEWQEKTNAIAMINSAQYMANPYYKPCALVLCNGEKKGPIYNNSVKGMLLSEPKDNLDDKLKKADLLDFDYDKFDHKTTKYQEGVQHWPILLDRFGKIKAKKTLWQANRTVVAKTNDSNILFLTTEGGYFTLYNFGRFLKESNERLDKGFNVHTAMNMDGGYEASMIIKTSQISYITYGEFETYGPGKDATIFDIKIKIPGVIGVFPRS